VVGGLCWWLWEADRPKRCGGIDRSAGDAKTIALRRLNLTSSKGLLDPPSYGAFAFRTANVLLPWRSR